MVYKQANYAPILHHSYSKREWSYQIAKDLILLKDKDYHFSGFISDGATGIIKGVFKVHPHSIHQICFAHIHRKLVSSLGKYSQDLRIIKLRKLADHIWLIESKEALSWWRKQIDKWVNDNFSYLREKRTDDISRSWFVHTKARKAVNLLRSIPDTSFKFLDHYLIPKTTNGLEGLFSVIRRKWRNHPGLSKKRWKQFLSWYIYFYNQDKLSQIRNYKD